MRLVLVLSIFISCLDVFPSTTGIIGTIEEFNNLIYELNLPYPEIEDICLGEHIDNPSTSDLASILYTV